MTNFVTLVWKVLETWFWCLSPCFRPWEIHWDHCQTPQIDQSGQNGHFWSFWPIKISYMGLKMAKFVTFIWKVLEAWFWCLSPGFRTWEIHWDHFQTPQIHQSGQNGHFWSFPPIKIRYRELKMAKFVTFVRKVLETWFWCLSPGFCLWEIIWDHF